MARALWGASWRMPTKAEFEELQRECQWKWTSQGNHVGLQITGPNGNSIFLPAAGWYIDGESSYVGMYGIYWTAKPNVEEPKYAYYFCAGSNSHDVLMNNRYYGLSIRPVLK